jgi:glutaconate CoA-transferase subunit A
MSPPPTPAPDVDPRALYPGTDERQPKLVTMAEAISRHVPDGASVVLGTFMEQKVPFAAAHEIIRQQRSDLELIGPVCDIVFDQMIGAGVVARVRASWAAGVTLGPTHCIMRAIESGIPRGLEVLSYSSLSLSLALTAGALGVPYLPTRSTLGTTLQTGNPALRTYNPPIGEGPLVAVEALRPDVAILAVQRSDVHGNSHNWGSFGVSVEAAHAARAVILVAEEMVPEETILSDPNRVIFPGLLVTAVVHEPWGSHPSPVQGAYSRDHDYYEDYAQASRTAEGFDEWLYQWITGVPDRRGYLRRLGEQRLAGLKLREHAYPAPVDYGY